MNPPPPPAPGSDPSADSAGAVPDSATDTARASSPKKQRSAAERIIVRVLILALAGVAIVEYRAWRSLEADRKALLSAMDESTKGYVTESEVKALATRYSDLSTETGLKANLLSASRVDTYRYSGLLKNRVLYLYYGLPRRGHEQELLEVTETPVVFYPPPRVPPPSEARGGAIPRENTPAEEQGDKAVGDGESEPQEGEEPTQPTRETSE